MPHFCCAGECSNSSENRKDLSFHSLPINNKPLLKQWIAKIKRHPSFFNVNTHTKICSAHFTSEDYINPEATKRRLKANAVPSIFAWTKEEDLKIKKRQSIAAKKLEDRRKDVEEATDSASEGEGDKLQDTSGRVLISRKTQTYEDESDLFSFQLERTLRITCEHRFSVGHLLSKCTTSSNELKLFSHFTGFNSYAEFIDTLRFLLPDLDRKKLSYWDSAAGKSTVIDCEKLFEEGFEEVNVEDDGEEIEANYTASMTRPSSHKLPVQDEFLMVMMKLRMGLSNIDLSERFSVSESTVNNILMTWLNFMYIIIGSLKIWPHRNIILANSPHEFCEKYPNNIIIVDATELKVQVPSSLQKHSESYSSYKSHTTFKCLIGVDPKGGILFVSQLYEGSISDKQIVLRSGLLETLKNKILVEEIAKGDAIMADKGFDIENDLKDLGLRLNIPPFLKDKIGFEEDDVIKTQTVAAHRIHVERAIGKIRRFRIFKQDIAVSMFGSINQIWSVACLLSNFQNPVLE